MCISFIFSFIFTHVGVLDASTTQPSDCKLSSCMDYIVYSLHTSSLLHSACRLWKHHRCYTFPLKHQNTIAHPLQTLKLELVVQLYKRLCWPMHLLCLFTQTHASRNESSELCSLLQHKLLCLSQLLPLNLASADLTSLE